MKAVLGLVENQGAGGIDDFVGDLIPAVGRKAVHEEGIFRRSIRFG
jgi:hypothetical protein